jgi:hypothetical protein
MEPQNATQRGMGDGWRCSVAARRNDDCGMEEGGDPPKLQLLGKVPSSHRQTCINLHDVECGQ